MDDAGNRLHLTDEGRRMEPMQALTEVFKILQQLEVNSCPAAPIDPVLPAENKSQWMKRVRSHWRARANIKEALGFKELDEEEEGGGGE